MKLINRSSFTLLAKAPFAEWIASLEGKIAAEDGYQKLSLAELRESGSVYLIDEVAQESDFDLLLSDGWQKMFENELSAWDQFADYWPVINYPVFTQWFEVQTNVMTFDLSTDQIMTAILD
ncbi:MAG: hypothetical protein OFPII_01530 [Osedax symbiont Rs1]|nr:MAG: hypothetical protein OFPII_01530 [Osedax symbiont Rs1]